MTTLLLRVLRDRRKGLIGWVTGILALVALQISVYPTIRNSQQGWSELTQQFPDALQQILRMTDYTSPTGYLSTELFSFTLPLIFVSIGATWGSRAAAEEEETGTADLLLSLPVSRNAVLGTRVTGVLLTLALMATVVVAALTAGTRAVDMQVPTVRIIQGAVALLLLSSVFGSLATAIGCITGRRGTSLAVSLTAGLAFFVLYSLAPLVHAMDNMLWANPFQWTLGAQPLVRGLPARYCLAAGMTSAALLLVARAAFVRRDIRA